MYQQERMDEIMKILQKNHYVTVDYLVKEIKYSPASIRRDLTLLEKQGKVPYYLNRSMKHFTFKIAYANIIKTIKDEKLSGKFIKAICAYMFDDEIPVDLTPPIDTYFKLFKKSFDLTKTRIKSGHVGGSKKKKEIINKRIETLEDFLNNNLFPILIYVFLYLFLNQNVQ